MFGSRLLHFSASAAFALTPAFAQYTAGSVTFAGAPSSEHEALLATAELRPGKSFSAAELQAAAQRLIDTGDFDDVGVTLDGPMKSVGVQFTLKPIAPPSRLEVSFDNLFWFTPEELSAGIHAKVPLYASTLPESGNLVDAVQSAIETMLRERGITAKLAHETIEPSPDRQARVIAYRVVEPRIVVNKVQLSGVSPAFAPQVREQAGKVTGSRFSDGLESRNTDERLLAPYLDGGYVLAHLAGRKLTPEAAAPNKIGLDLSGTVVPGGLLHVGTLTWAGSPELSAAAFAAAAPLHTGSLASITELSKTIDLLVAPYRKQGYADVLVDASSQVDEAAGTISYVFSVTPGEQYRIRSVTPMNLTPTQQADFDHAWKMQPGDLFNPDYIAHFLENNTALKSFRNSSASYKAVRDPAAHLVDLTVVFGGSVT